MFDFFDGTKYKEIIMSLAMLTAQIDDRPGIDNPFIKMTRSPNHMIAWFLIYAATEPTQLDTLLEKLKSLAHQHGISLIATQETREIKQGLEELIKHPGMIKVLSYFADKIKVELNADPSQYIAKVRENGYLNLAEFLSAHAIIKFRSEINGICITSTAEQSVQWHKSLLDTTPGRLSLTKEPLTGGNLKFFSYHPSTGELTQITAGKQIIAMAPAAGFSLAGDVHSFEQINLHIPLPKGKCELSIDVARREVDAGLYFLFNDTTVANIGVTDIKVFIQGKARLDKDGAFASQTQEVQLYRCASPNSVDLTFKQQPTALFFDAAIAANFEPEPKQSSANSPILLVELKTKWGGMLLLSPVHLNSIAALKLMHTAKQKHPISIGRRLFQEVGGKSADDGGRYNVRYTEFQLLFAAFLSSTRSQSAHGVLFSLSECEEYIKYYKKQSLEYLAKEISYLLQTILYNHFSAEESAQLLSKCAIIQRSNGNIDLQLSHALINLFLAIGIDLRIPEVMQIEEQSKSTPVKTLIFSVQPPSKLTSDTATPSTQPPPKVIIKEQDENRVKVREYLTTHIIPELQAKDKVFAAVHHMRLSNFVVKLGNEHNELEMQDVFLVCKSAEEALTLANYLKQFCIDLAFDFELVDPVSAMYWGRSFKPENQQHLIGISSQDLGKFFEYFTMPFDLMQLLTQALPWYSNYLKYHELDIKIEDTMRQFSLSASDSDNNCLEYALLKHIGLAMKPASCMFGFDKYESSFYLQFNITPEESQKLLDACHVTYGPQVCVRRVETYREDMQRFFIPIQGVLDKWDEIAHLIVQEVPIHKAEKRKKALAQEIERLLENEPAYRRNLEEDHTRGITYIKEFLNKQLYRFKMRDFNVAFIESLFKIERGLITSVQPEFSPNGIMIRTISNKHANELEKIIRLKLESKFNKSYGRQIDAFFLSPIISLYSSVVEDLLSLLPALKNGTERFLDIPEVDAATLSQVSRVSDRAAFSTSEFSADRFGKLFGFDSKLIISFEEDICSNSLIIKTLNAADAQLIGACMHKILADKISSGHLWPGGILGNEPEVEINSSALDALKTFISNSSRGVTAHSSLEAKSPTFFGKSLSHSKLLRDVSGCLSPSDASCDAVVNAIKSSNYSLALRKACAGNKSKLVKLILQYKDPLSIDINEPSSNGNTALDWLINSALIQTPSAQEIKNLLIANGAISKEMPKGNLLF